MESPYAAAGPSALLAAVHRRRNVPDYNTIAIERFAEGSVLVRLNRPEVRNAMNLEMVRELRQAVAELAEQADTRAIIFAGAGNKAFVGGADIAELRQRTREHALQQINNGLLRQIELLPVPTIAAIEGFALGGGSELALACDMRVCGRGARFGQPEVSLGIIPGAGATYRLSHLVGPGMARELVFTGRIIDADEALRIGLVNRVVEDGQAEGCARDIAEEIAKNSTWAVRYAKQALLHTPGIATESAMAFEAAAQAVLFEDEEKARRMDAFLQRSAARRAARDPGEG